MKIHIILLPFLCGGLGAMLEEERVPILQHKTKKVLKDIRLVPMNKVQQSQEEDIEKNLEDQIQVEPNEPNLEEKKINTRALQAKSGKENTFQSGSKEQNNELVQNSKEYIQKMANQLFLAQKQVSLLSDYQKNILSQDPLVKRFVFGPSEEERVPKPFSRLEKRTRINDSTKNAPSEEHQITTRAPRRRKNFDSKKVAEPKISHKSDNLIRNPHNDNFAQAAEVKYVTITPITTSGHINVKVIPPKEPLVQTPKPFLFYDVTVSRKPPVKEISLPTTRVPYVSPSPLPLVSSTVLPKVSSTLLPRVKSRASSRASRYIQDSGDHYDQNYGSAKYEFKYNVKDHEKNSHFGHMETRSDETTFGYYFVHLPDGRLETVKYWADKTGYHAKVDYQGEAKHPPAAEYKHHQQLYH